MLSAEGIPFSGGLWHCSLFVSPLCSLGPAAAAGVSLVPVPCGTGTLSYHFPGGQGARRGFFILRTLLHVRV